MPEDVRESASMTQQRLRQALLVGTLTFLAGALLFWTGALAGWETKIWDIEVRHLAHPAPTTDQIRLIFLDQSSLDWGTRQGWAWPWPREVYAPVIDFCKRGGAKAIAFDVIFSEPSDQVDQDTALGNAIHHVPAFVGALFVGNSTGSATNWPSSVPAPGIEFHPSAGTALAPYILTNAVFPIPDLATNATLLGSVFGNPDPDGIYRRLRPFSLFDGKVVPSLGLAAYLAPATNRTLSLRGDRVAINNRPLHLALDEDGEAILRYRGSSKTHLTVNISGVIESDIQLTEGKKPLLDPAFFKDSYVLLGFTAPGLKDLRPAPLDPIYPGVEIHATFLDNLLADDFIRDAPPAASLLMALLLSLAAALAVRFGRHAWLNVLTITLFITIPPILGVAAYEAGIWVPVVFLLVAAVPSMIGALALNYAMEGRQKRFIKGAFKQYLSPVVIEELVQHPERLTLGGEQRELSIFFSDIKGFTSISERLSPVELTALLNDYLTAMTELIYAHGGTVDKYQGDAIVAFWNAPLTQTNHATLAVRSALECQVRLDALNPDFDARIGTTLHQRIGINTGAVVVGNMGSQQRFNYTFLGDAGNLASRLEGINKHFGTGILISEYTRNLLDGSLAAREIACVQVVGKQEAVRIFEPLLPDLARARQGLLSAFAAGLDLYYKGALDEAEAHFATLADKDPAAAAYVRRCQAMRAHPPAGKWTGIWTMTEK